MFFKNWLLLSESKQSIVSFGFPEIIAKLFYKKFGNNAPLIAKWFRDSKNNWQNDNWWMWQMGSTSSNRANLADLTKLYHASFDEKKYLKAVRDLGLAFDTSRVNELYLKDMRDSLKDQIEDKLFDDYFFNYSIIKAIADGEIKDLSPYKSLPFQEALRKYEQKKIFKEMKPIKVYKNGYKWINVGKKCSLVGDQLNNCGSAGLMSWDRDSTMIVLFDQFNKAHVVVTYSPNEKRISGDQGGASTAVKTKYHKYVLDLSDILDARFDYSKSKSILLSLKYRLKNKAKNIQQLRKNNFYDSAFRFVIGDTPYYSNEHTAVLASELEKVQKALRNGEIKLPIRSGSPVSDLFNWRNIEILRRFGVNYIPIDDLISR